MGLRDRYRAYVPTPPDSYAAAEREAIQREEDGLASDDYGDIPGFDNVVPISLEAYRQILDRLQFGGKNP